RSERLDQRFVERCRVLAEQATGIDLTEGLLDDALGFARPMRHTAPVELAKQVAQPFGEHRDLDLLEGHRHDPAALAGLEEERPVARSTDRPGDEAVGRIEDVATSRHARNLYPIPAGPTARGRPRQDTPTSMVCQPRAPWGAGRDGISSWSAPVPSVARTLMVCWPAVASHGTTHWTQVASEMGVDSCASRQSPSTG